MHKRITVKRIVKVIERAQRSLDNPGFCTACGISVEGVEPDAEKYVCEQCDKPAVYGAEQLLLMLA